MHVDQRNAKAEALVSKAKDDGFSSIVVMLWDDENHWVLRVNQGIDPKRLRVLGEFLIKSTADVEGAKNGGQGEER